MAQPKDKFDIEVYEKLSEQVGTYDAKTIAVIHNSVAQGTSVSEFTYFLNVAKGVGLNPFNKEIWCYKDNKGNLLVFAGRDGMLKKAQENPAFNGIRSSEVKANDKFSIDIANAKIKHTIATGDRGETLGGYAIVFRKDGEPTVSFVEFKRYEKNFKYEGIWQKYPEDMIKKVAEMKALKLAFGFSGVQIEEDFEVREGVAIPNEIEEPLREVTEEYFKKFSKSDPAFIAKHIDKYAWTEEQRTTLEKIISDQKQRT